MTTRRTLPELLRLACAFSFLPAFPLCLAYGIISHRLVPSIGLVPLAFSGAYGIFLANRIAAERSDDRIDSDSKVTHPSVIFLVDILLAAGLMTVYVLSWVIAPAGNNKVIMLSAYAALPIFFNFLIHFYFSVRAFYLGLGLNHVVQWVVWQALPSECPNCHHQLRPDPPTWQWPGDPRRSYSKLFIDDPEDAYHDEEGEPSQMSHT